MGPRVRGDDGLMDTTSCSRDAMRPKLCISFALRRSEGAGKAGCALHPRSRRRVANRFAAHEHTGSADNTPASPTQWLYGLYEIVLMTLLFVTPSLAGSVGCRWTWRLHRGVGPKRFRRTQAMRSSFAPSRPSLPAPRLRRRPTPLWWDRMARVLQLICPAPAIYFYAQGWTGFCWFARRAIMSQAAAEDCACARGWTRHGGLRPTLPFAAP